MNAPKLPKHSFNVRKILRTITVLLVLLIGGLGFVKLGGLRSAAQILPTAWRLQPSETSPAEKGVTAARNLLRAQNGGQTAGTPWTGNAGVRERVSEIMDRQRQTGDVLTDEEETETQKIRPNRKILPQDPNARALPQWPPAQTNVPQQSISPTSPQTLSTSFTGATLSGTNPTSAFPPDTMGAVGPTQYVVAVNNRIVTFNKTTGVADGVINATTNTFFNSVRNASGTSDPRIRYDRLTQRWFVVIINVSTPNRILVAVSDAASAGVISASTVFTFFFIPVDTTPPSISNTCLADYPTLGVDSQALYIGTNNFCGSPQTFDSTDGYVVRKSSVLGAGPLVVTPFRGLVPTGSSDGPYTPQGVDNYDATSNEGYFVGVSNSAFGRLILRRVGTPGGTPTISADIAITVNSTSFPLTVPHLGNTGGTNGNLDGLDDRLFAAHIRNGRLWTAHNIAVNSAGTGSTSGTGRRTAVRWYELQNVVGAGTPSVFQSGTVFDSAATNPRFYWIPSVMVSGQGHAALGFSAAGAADRANAATVGRLLGDTLGTTQTPELYTASSTAYNPPSDTGAGRGARRWGDYSYTSLDPNDDMTMWTIQQFCDVTNSYGVRVVKLLAPPPATLTGVSPASIATGQASVSVTITGTSTAGSGFFDPGAGFANRIAALVSGGVTVNGVTYNSPTSITVDLSTVGAVVGTKDVTITNPDGQTATGNALITVTSGCTFTISPTSQNFGAAGGSNSVGVTTVSGCGWSAVSNAGWLTINTGTPGSGNGTVSYTASANPGPQRSGTLTVAGQTLTVTQDSGCTFTISPTSQNFGAAGGSNSVGVTTVSGCGWSAVSNAGWLTINTGTPGSGNGTVNYTASANPGPQRSGTLTVAGQTLTVTQDSGCTFTISPTSQNFGAAGGSNSVGVTTVSGCGWSAVSNAGWLTINTGTPGSGNGTVNYTASANPGPQRSGTLTVAGQTLTVTQDSGCTFTISPTSQNFGAAGGSNSVGVTAVSGCGWSAVSNAGWLTINTGTPGSGNGTVNYTASANPGPQRSGTLTVAGQTLTVTQDSGCTFTISPTSQNFGAAGGSNSVGVTTVSGCGWSAVSNAGWLTINTGTPGSGNGTVSYTASANPGPQRSGTLTVAGQTLTVTQDSGCTFTISPTSQNFGAAGGSNSVGVTTVSGCGWSAVSNAGWLTINTGTPGSGNGTVNYTASANPGPQRSGTLTVAGQTLTVTQSNPRARKADFDGDGKTDLSVWRGPVGNWLLLNSSNGALQTIQWGSSLAPYNDVTVPGDYDGDGKVDVAIWRGADSIWYIRPSAMPNSPILDLWGVSSAPYFDTPTPGDFDGDGKTDLAVWRSSTGTWFIKRSSDGGFQIEVWGVNGDTPVAADYDGDGKTDLAVWRGATGDWLIKRSSGGTETINWGVGIAPYFDVPVPGDYDGDGKVDVGIWRGADEIWYIRPSATPNAPILQLWGTSNAPYFDIPAQGDYDGDGKTDIAVWRRDGTWFVLRSSNGTFLIQQNGQNGDTPVPSTGVR